MLIEDLSIDALPNELTGQWQLVNLAIGADHEIFRVTLPDGGQRHVTLSVGGLKRLKLGLEKAGIDPLFFAWPPANEPDRAPYRGLKPLEREDAGIFFGRDAEIIDALDRLRGLSEAPQPRLLVILGASGSGKSSFMRAGLWPRLKRDDRTFFPMPVIRPERAVLMGEGGLVRSLEDAFRTVGAARARADVRKAVEGGAPTFLPVLAELAAKCAPPPIGVESPRAPVLVFAIDQGEELFRSEGSDEVTAFLSLLRAMLITPAPSCMAIITIRSDAYEPLQTADALDGVPQTPFSLPPLAKGAYLEVIEGPARRLAATPRTLKIEPALSRALLKDIDGGGSKDALPLLAFILQLLYEEYGGAGTLLVAGYDALGRITGCIEKAVERALKASDIDPAVPRDRAAKLALLRRGLIPWLAGIDPETGLPRRRVARLAEIPAEARPLINHLVDARLLSTDKDSETGEITIEPSHEVLLRQWGILRGWLDEDFGALTALESVRRSASEWAANGERPEWLVHKGARLKVAEDVFRETEFGRLLQPFEVAYLRKARRAERAKLTLRVALAILALFICLGAWDYTLWISAQNSLRSFEYEDYLKKAPLGLFAKLARDRIDQAKEFSTLSSTDLQMYKTFGEKYDLGPFHNFANLRYGRSITPKVKNTIFENSLVQQIDVSALDAKNCDELFVAKNEIYYRLGRCFTSAKALSFFSNDDCPRSCAAFRAINEAVDSLIGGTALDNFNTINKVYKKKCPKDSPLLRVQRIPDITQKVPACGFSFYWW